MILPILPKHLESEGVHARLVCFPGTRHVQDGHSVRLNKILQPGYLSIESLVTVVGSRFVDVNSRFLHLGSVFESQSAASGEDQVQAEHDRAITLPDIALRPHGIGNTRQLGKFLVRGNPAIFRSAPPRNEAAVFEADFDCEIQSGAIRARLAATN